MFFFFFLSFFFFFFFLFSPFFLFLSFCVFNIFNLFLDYSHAPSRSQFSIPLTPLPFLALFALVPIYTLACGGRVCGEVREGVDPHPSFQTCAYMYFCRPDGGARGRMCGPDRVSPCRPHVHRRLCSTRVGAAVRGCRCVDGGMYASVRGPGGLCARTFPLACGARTVVQHRIYCG
jgi:hypothetical protein